MSWTLVYGGAEKLFSDWGLNHLARNLVSQGLDTVTFDADGANLDSDPLFAYGSTVVIKKDGAQWFAGYVVKIPAQGGPRSERLSYELAGPWYYLTQFVYQQTWVSYLNNQKQPAGFTSHLILNVNPANGLFVTTGAQIIAALNYALAQFPAGKAPFQIGAITPALTPPLDEIRDLTCAEVIRKQLRWHPDAVTWFDYSTTPPTFNCKRLTELAAVNLQLPTAATLLANAVPNISEVSVTPRYDLQRPAVAIKYEVKTSINNIDFLSVITDIWPPGNTGQELSALTATIDLQGARITTVKGSLRVEPISINDLNWWVRKFKELGDSRIGGVSALPLGFTPGKDPARFLTGLDGKDNPTAGLPNELIEGQVAPWMKAGGVAINAQQETITAYFDFDLYNQNLGPQPGTPAAGYIERIRGQLKALKLVTTDAPSGDYQSLASIQQGDVRPVGLAKFLYDALSILTYSGSLSLIEQECSGAALIGNTINLLGGRAEWTAMKGMLQQIGEDIDTGTTRLSFGPPEHLGAGDLAELLRVNRYRLRWTNPSTQQDGGIAGTSDVQLGKQTANTNSFQGEDTKEIFSVATGATLMRLDAAAAQVNLQNGYNQVLLQLTKCNGKTLSIHEFAVCVVNADGTQSAMKALLIASDPY